VSLVRKSPFEEKEEGTCIASDVVEVEGEDPANPGYYLKSVDTRKPRDRHDSPISGSARPYESCTNILRSGPPEMPLRSWYNCDIKHFRLTDFCQTEIKTPPRLSNKTSIARSYAEDLILENKSLDSEQDFKYLY